LFRADSAPGFRPSKRNSPRGACGVTATADPPAVSPECYTNRPSKIGRRHTGPRLLGFVPREAPDQRRPPFDSQPKPGTPVGFAPSRVLPAKAFAPKDVLSHASEPDTNKRFSAPQSFNQLSPGRIRKPWARFPDTATLLGFSHQCNPIRSNPTDQPGYGFTSHRVKHHCRPTGDSWRPIASC
jgi:hypothetical protein